MTGTAASISPKEFGAFVRQLRQQQGLELTNFGQRAGLSPGAVEILEAGDREFEFAELLAIGRGLGMDVSAIFRMWETRQPAAHVS